MDECMGSQNLLTEKCEEGYGPDVLLFDCLTCGMMCGCEAPDDCDLKCHNECMTLDAASEVYNWTDGSSYGSYSSYGDHGDGECTLYYGANVDVKKCEDCGGSCWETAFDNVGADS